MHVADDTMKGGAISNNACFRYMTADDKDDRFAIWHTNTFGQHNI